jgi:hypothetical protein
MKKYALNVTNHLFDLRQALKDSESSAQEMRDIEDR